MAVPECFKGPFGSHYNYLIYFCFENCQDYFRLVQQQKEQDLCNTPDRYRRLRYFLNAIESLNNVLEYFFFENMKERDWNIKDKGQIIGRIRGGHTILKEIAEIANAYKHCTTSKSGKPNAADLQECKLEVEINLGSGVNVEYDFQTIDDEEVLKEAFSFWMEFNTVEDKVNYLLNSAKTKVDNSPRRNE